MKRCREVTSTAVFRLSMILFAVVIPLNLLTLVLAGMAISEAERQVAGESQNSLRLYMVQVDDAMDRIQNKLYLTVRQDADFAWLNTKPMETPSETYRALQSVVRLNNTLEGIVDDYRIIDGTFEFFPDKDIFMLQGDTSVSSPGMRQMVEQHVQEEKQPVYQGWQVMQMGQRDVLAFIAGYQDAYYGAWIGMETLSEAMELNGYANTNTLQLLTDSGGEVYASNDRTLIHLQQDQVNSQYAKAHSTVRADSTVADLSYVQLIPRWEISGALPLAIRVMQILAVAALGIIPIIIVALQRWFVSPVHKLTEAMRRIEQGDMNYRIEEKSRALEFARIYHHFNHMMDEVSELKISVYEKQLESQKIKMRFLSQQIQPHFILNALNVLYSYEQQEYPLIQKMILCLSRYFRYVVNANADFVELGPELVHIGNYFEIQQARYLKNFQATVSCDPELKDCLVPPLLIQNFAENVIKHSLSMEGTVNVTIQVRKEGTDMLYIGIADNGSGISQTVLDRIQRFRETRQYQDGLGIGIQNSIERIDMLYGGAGTLNISRRVPRGTLVEIRLPIRREEGIDHDGDFD